MQWHVTHARDVLSLRRRATHHQHRPLSNEGVRDLAVVDDGRGEDVAARDDGLVDVIDGHRGAGARQLQVDLVEVTQAGNLLQWQGQGMMSMGPLVQVAVVHNSIQREGLVPGPWGESLLQWRGRRA